LKKIAKVECQQCKKEIKGGVSQNYQNFDTKEPTTIHVFCSESCETIWVSSQEKNKKK